MDAVKGYYAILGVLPSVEDVVIRAAYKALAQRYHPDRVSGDKAEATGRMAAINEAYAVLSDPIRRKEYDKLRGNSTRSSDSYFEEDAADVPPAYDPAPEVRLSQVAILWKWFGYQLNGTSELGDSFAKWLGLTLLTLVALGIVGALLGW